MSQTQSVETDVVVVGTGPAGASSAALLSSYGVRNMVVSRYPWTSRTPRSHITNQRTMEIMRDLGIEEEALGLATPQELMGENTYCTSLAGEDLGRIRTWGTHPLRRADYELASPGRYCDLPQNLLEPLLVRTAAARGSEVRFSTEYLAHQQDQNGVTVTVSDRLTGSQHEVRAKYLIGADGANSKVLADADLPIEGRMGVSGSMNIVFEADLTQYVAHRPSVLYWVIQPGSDVGGLGIGVVRMVRPWHRWLAIWGYDIQSGPPQLTEQAARDIVHNLIGDDSVPVRIDSTSTWTVNDAYAARNTSGRVFCLGDAVHRHPPTNGLGSNTSIQDAYNLCWKLAHVLRGHADPSLLQSYDAERTPIAAQVVRRANQSLGDFPPILAALGMLDAETPQEMNERIAARLAPTADGARQRQALRAAIAGSNYVYNCHGVELNQRYRSRAVISDGSPEPAYERDAELYYQPTTWPGAHLPHAWIQAPGARRCSTLDLCGNGRFTLLTGIGGDAWRHAGEAVGEALGLEVVVCAIGPGEACEDPFGDWAQLREIDDDGALLVRPDLHVAWRALGMPADPHHELLEALCSLLGHPKASVTPGLAQTAGLVEMSAG